MANGRPNKAGRVALILLGPSLLILNLLIILGLKLFLPSHFFHFPRPYVYRVSRIIHPPVDFYPIPPPVIVDPQIAANFHAAITVGNLNDVQNMLQQHPELLNAQLSATGNSPIHTAVDADQIDIVKFLLEKGATTEDHGLMIDAAMSGDNDIISLLLDHDADVNSGTDPKDLGAMTPIRVAELYGHLDTAKFLEQNGARIDFFSAAGLGWKGYVADQLKKDPTLASLKDDWGNEATWVAVNTGQTDVVKLLLSYGGSYAGTYGEQKFTALHIAAQRDYESLALLLINDGVDVNAKDLNGETPLDYALDNDQIAMANLLRKYGAKR
ncbi:MAG TPA: ankyrin repeat domain-containing protein [Phycisphaerae bacterium]|nr:ankyrin repeat domain-containing protein [Phycisphaerae bacterium]